MGLEGPTWGLWNFPSRVSMEVIVTSKLAYFTYLGNLQPICTWVIKHLLSTGRTSQLTSWVFTNHPFVGCFVQVCSSSSECSSVMCHENFFNADGDANNGCEATCAVLLQATV